MWSHVELHSVAFIVVIDGFSHLLGIHVRVLLSNLPMENYQISIILSFTSGTIVLGRLIGSSLVESFTNSYTLTDPNGTEEKYT